MSNKLVFEDKMSDCSCHESGMSFISKQMMIKTIQDKKTIIVDPEFEPIYGKVAE